MHTYAGESPSKTLTRILYWETLKEHLGHDFKDSHLVLCGEGGDVRQAQALNAGPVTAVDLDKERLNKAKRAFQRQHGNLRRHDFVHGNMCEIEGKFAHVLLDWCEVVRPETMERSLRILDRTLREGGMFGLCFSYGMQGRPRKGQPPLFACIEGETREEKVMRRIKYVNSWLQLHCGKAAPAMVGAWYYDSSTAEKKGSPMVYMLFDTSKPFTGIPKPVLCKWNEEQREQEAREAFEDHKGSYFADSSRVSDRFMLNPKKIGAWHAWQTMRARKHAP